MSKEGEPASIAVRLAIWQEIARSPAARRARAVSRVAALALSVGSRVTWLGTANRAMAARVVARALVVVATKAKAVTRCATSFRETVTAGSVILADSFTMALLAVVMEFSKAKARARARASAMTIATMVVASLEMNAGSRMIADEAQSLQVVLERRVLPSCAAGSV